MKVLAVVAHPDDEVLGCGGTIARLAKEANQVYVAILGEGITSRYQRREEANKSLIQTIHSRSRAVGRYLSVKRVFSFNLPDNRFDTVPLLDVIKIVETVIGKLQPEIVYTHHSGDLNIDHRIVSQAVLTATRPVKECQVKDVYTFEVASSTEWAFNQQPLVFNPNVFVDISRTLETKIKALQLYESEVRAFPHPRSPEALRAIAKRWGSTAGLEAAEAFQLVRSVR